MRSRDAARLAVVQGNGAKLKPRTPTQKRIMRERARQLQQETAVELSEFLPRPLTYAWEDARRGRQRFWGNLLNHSEELVDADAPPTFEQLLMMAEVLAWHLVDLCIDRGIPVDLPDPPTPIQHALLKRKAA